MNDASISTDPKGNRTVQFVGHDRKRQSIRLGKVPLRLAEQVKLRVEYLNAAKITGHAIDADTARWLAELEESLEDKLAQVGLIPKPERTTLDAFLANFITSRTDTKPRTRKKYESTRRKLVSFFGAQKTLREITPGDADDFRRKLLSGGIAENTVRKHVAVAKVFFTAAKRKRLVPNNPFDGLKSAIQPNASRFYFVRQEEARKVLEACTDDEFRVIFALSRYGGLRCPSEHLSLRWGDVDWNLGRITVPSPKTAHHAGHESRMIPLFPELRPYLEAVYDAAPEGAIYVISRYRDAEANLRSRLTKTIRRAGLNPWPKLFQNLRSTRQTELEEVFPSHVVCAWMGNSRPVAQKHYLQVTDEHFARAVHNAVQVVQKAVQQPDAPNRTECVNPVKNESLRNSASPKVAEAGLEPARG